MKSEMQKVLEELQLIRRNANAEAMNRWDVFTANLIDKVSIDEYVELTQQVQNYAKALRESHIADGKIQKLLS